MNIEDVCHSCEFANGGCTNALMYEAAKSLEKMENALNSRCWCCKYGKQVSALENGTMTLCQHSAEMSSRVLRNQKPSCDNWEFEWEEE